MSKLKAKLGEKIVNQINPISQDFSATRNVIEEARSMKYFQSCKIHVRREANLAAHALAKSAL